jgi:heterodisulfide reductase subunit B2
MSSETLTVTNFADEVSSRSGQNVYLCYQCKKCTSGCPVAELMDYHPNQIMRMIQLGQREKALDSKTVWLCAGCETCTTRCPHGIDVTRVMDAVKAIANEEGKTKAVPSVAAFNKAFLSWVNRTGRSYEIALLAQLKMGLMFKGKLDPNQFIEDAAVGAKMFATGKLKILPPRHHKSGRRINVASGQAGKVIAYYPGCSLHSSGVEFDMSTKCVADKLGLIFSEPDGWGCCGASSAHAVSHTLETALPAKNLLLMEQQGYDEVAVPCAACFSRLKAAAYHMNEDEELRDEVSHEIGGEYHNKVKVNHLLDVFTEEVGLDKIRQKVVMPLNGMKVVCYYGCLLTRPPEITGAKNPEYPTNMDDLMRALGAESLDWSYKTDCCGASFSLTEPEVVLKLTQRILENAKDVGADAVVVACPLCHANLDTRQEQISNTFGRQYDLPVFYFTELMGMAMGCDVAQLGWYKHAINPLPLLKRKGFVDENSPEYREGGMKAVWPGVPGAVGNAAVGVLKGIMGGNKK